MLKRMLYVWMFGTLLAFVFLSHEADVLKEMRAFLESLH